MGRWVFFPSVPPQNKTKIMVTQIQDGASRDTNRRLNSQSVQHIPYVPLKLAPSPDGLKFDVGLDWLQGVGTLAPSLFQAFLPIVAPLDGDSIDVQLGRSRSFGRNHYSHTAVSASGSRVHFDITETGLVRFFFSVPGSVLRCLSLQQQVRLLFSLSANCSRFTRIDVAVNDYTKRFDPRDLRDWCRQGFLRRFRDFNLIAPETRIDGQTYVKGATLYLGSRESERYPRIYYAAPLHGFDAVRYEQEFKGDMAQCVAIALVNSITSSEDTKRIIHCFSSLAFYHIDFVSPESVSERDLSRCESLSEWREFVDSIVNPCDDIVIPAPRSPKPLSDTIAWLYRQCSRTLAVLKKIFGVRAFDRFVRRLLETGDRKIENCSRSLIAFAKRHLFDFQDLDIDDYEFRDPKLKALGG